MFAFAIYEHARGRLVLARDRLGVKPLYLADVGGALRFASTLPALLAGGGIDTAIDPVALHHYLSWHAVVPAPRTILNGRAQARRRRRRCSSSPTASGDLQRYWRADFSRQDRYADWTDEPTGHEAVLEALRTAVRRRMVSDVPVGVLLSGGLDSSLIVALLADSGPGGLATFSIGFDDVGEPRGQRVPLLRRDRRASSTPTTTGSTSTTDRMLPALDGAIAAMSEPMVSHDAVAFYLLSEEVSQSYKVVQSGQGADEVFAGYSWYPPLRDAAGSGADAYQAAFFDRDARGDGRHARPTPTWLADDPSRAFLDRHFAAPGADDPVDRALRLDTEIMLVDDPVKRVDNMTMAWGLEARTPFLDHELVELAAACPPELKLAYGGKGVLKDAARQRAARGRHRPAQGLLPGARALDAGGRDARADPRDDELGAARARGLFRPEHVRDAAGRAQRAPDDAGGIQAVAAGAARAVADTPWRLTSRAVARRSTRTATPTAGSGPATSALLAALAGADLEELSSGRRAHAGRRRGDASAASRSSSIRCRGCSRPPSGSAGRRPGAARPRAQRVPARRLRRAADRRPPGSSTRRRSTAPRATSPTCRDGCRAARPGGDHRL